MNYNETLEYLYSSIPSFQDVGIGAYKPGLERITQFCKILGNPQRNYFVVHVAGTNGKGSVSHMLAAVLQQAGYQVGLFTSPHLLDFRERIRVQGEIISKQKVVNFIDRHKHDIEQLGLSYFEMVTAMAFDYFAQSDVEIAVIETGLGGRLDATNIVIPLLSVITNIGYEHTELLGDTLPKIAREKGGIIKKCVPVILGEKDPAYNLVLEEIAKDNQSEITYASDVFECVDQYFEEDKQVFSIIRKDDAVHYLLRTTLMGEYQRQNVLTTATAVHILHYKTPITITRRAFIDGIRDVVEATSLRGRWQQLASAPQIICDTGHNSHGLKFVAQQLQHHIDANRHVHCIMGFCSDKDVSAILRLMPKECSYTFTQANVQRAKDKEEIKREAEEIGLKVQTAENVPEAIEKVIKEANKEDLIFIGGSNFIVGEALNYFQE
ncbi:MAG: bifunctional folylpolyglutamate synthase/dihydrofolate synthase [Alistipes sp.]|nr:bifunctional folylpolyglutamate synthase/dihydrofolate synthase [Candidatus Alistipes equi]